MLPITTHQRCESGKIFLMRQRDTLHQQNCRCLLATATSCFPTWRRTISLSATSSVWSRARRFQGWTCCHFKPTFCHQSRDELVICRIFIPFRKDEMKGTVVQLDRGSKSRGGRWMQDIICKIQRMNFYFRHVWPKIFILKGLDWRNSGKEEMRERFLEWLRSRYELE